MKQPAVIYLNIWLIHNLKHPVIKKALNFIRHVTAKNALKINITYKRKGLSGGGGPGGDLANIGASQYTYKKNINID